MDLLIVDKTETLSEQLLNMTQDLLDFSAKELSLADDTEMSVTFVNNQEIQEINREYRDKDRATDVISFAIEDDSSDELANLVSEAMLDEFPRNLGDIFVSIDKANEQAKEYGHSFERELGFLIVHGFLHLNGYDHMIEEDEKEMFKLQRKILDDYGLQR